MYYQNTFVNADESSLFNPSMLRNLPYCQVQNFDARTMGGNFLQQNSAPQNGASIVENSSPSFIHTASEGTPLPSSMASTSISSDTEDSGINTTTKFTQNVKPKMELINRNLWLDFHKITNEMVVNKAGRKMFPKIELRISGLDPQGHYFIILRMRTVDNCRYKFQGGTWSPAGHDALPEWSNHVPHHEGPNGTGEFWMRNPLAFDRVKLTNRPKGEGSLIALSSMHKYQPSVELYTVGVGNKEPICVLAPKELQFIAVTAYQSQAIIDLKILHNPFAKGFREGSARKRSLSYSPESKDSSGNSSNSPPTKQLAFGGMSQMNAATAALFFPPNLAATSFPQPFNLGGVSFGQQMPQNYYNLYSNALMNDANSAMRMANNGQYYPNPGFRYNQFSTFPNYGHNLAAGQNNNGSSTNNFNSFMGANSDSSAAMNMTALQNAASNPLYAAATLAMLATNCSVPSTASAFQCAVPPVNNSSTLSPANTTNISTESSAAPESEPDNTDARLSEGGNLLLPENILTNQNYLNFFCQQMMSAKSDGKADDSKSG